jgi:hypothetical protein
LREGLEKPSEDEIQKGTEALNAFKTASKADKTAMKIAYFELIGSLDYHIKTEFKFFKSEQADAIAKLYEKEMKVNLFEKIATEIAGKIDVELPSPSDISDADSFREALKNFKAHEKEQGEQASAKKVNQQREEYLKIYKEFKFVAEQKEGREGSPTSIKEFYSKSLTYFKSGETDESKPQYDKALLVYRYALQKADPNWDQVRTQIAQRKIAGINADVKAGIYEKPEELLGKYRDIVDTNGAQHQLHKLEEEFSNLEKTIKDPKKKKPSKQDKSTQGNQDIVQKMKAKLDIEIPIWMKGRLDNIFANKDEKQIKAIEDVIKKIGKSKSLQWRDFEEQSKNALRDLRMQEQLTKKLAPYLMERIKNRKPIDNRLINMIKPRKSQKGKSK